MLVWLISQDFIQRLIADELKISVVDDAEEFFGELLIDSTCVGVVNYIMYVHQVFTCIRSLYKAFLEANHHILLKESSAESVKLQKSLEVIE
jgi:hypothetical protein